MERKVVICDICNRDLDKVDTYSFSGHGSLTFTWTLGGHGGGAGDTIKLRDVCCECTAAMRAVIEKEIKKIRDMGKTC